MYDWEQYYSRNATPKDDPWDLSPEERKKKRAKLRKETPESHNPSPNHIIGSCAPDVSFSSAMVTRKKKSSPAKIIVPIIVVVFFCFGAITSLVEEMMIDDTFSILEPDEQYAGNDNFDVSIDPDEDANTDGETVDIWEPEVGPSEIELYTGPSDFSLQLHGQEGLTPLTYQEIYTRVLPSVVTITVYNDTSGAYATGIILSEDGYILTNQHVVACQTNAQVTTMDNVTYDALLVGEDPNTDLALLKIDAAGLTPAEFADSNEIMVGDECFAIGNPLGITYRASFTNGIISAVSRNVNMNDYTMDLIQTNAALNSGNSGGPLINVYGQVIGVNNMKLVDTEVTVEGMGFAIPSATAKRITDSLIQYGEVEHPLIGITCYAVTAGDYEGNEIDGVYVYTVSAGSDAAAKGLTEGDIITHLNGTRIYQVSDIDLTGLRVGDAITVTVYRAGETFDITFQLVEQNELG